MCICTGIVVTHGAPIHRFTFEHTASCNTLSVVIWLDSGSGFYQCRQSCASGITNGDRVCQNAIRGDNLVRMMIIGQFRSLLGAWYELVIRARSSGIGQLNNVIFAYFSPINSRGLIADVRLSDTGWTIVKVLRTAREEKDLART